AQTVSRNFSSTPTPIFLPHLWGNMLPLWCAESLSLLSVKYNCTTLKPFSDLHRQFCLDSKDIWRFFQLRHCIVQLYRDQGKVPLLGELLPFYELTRCLPHTAALIYSHLISIPPASMIGPLEYWVRELELELEEGERESLMRNMYLPLREARLKLQHFKIVNRLYWTPSHLGVAGLQEGRGCWFCSAQVGDLQHMLWECENLTRFWDEVLQFCGKVLDRPIP
uniref:Mitotic arrest deficient 1 like 1 n=1 Tax=Latimeria chalumnae TaxID=7897 RepID=H3BCV7_LATCH